MRLKDGLILREVAGQYVVVPIGNRVSEITKIIYMTASGALLWQFMENKEFEINDLIEILQVSFPNIGAEQLAKDVHSFIDMLSKNRLLDDGKITRSATIRFKK